LLIVYHPLITLRVIAVLGMSTRKGTVKFLNEILEEASSTMMEQMLRNEAKFAQIEDPKRCADVLGMSAVKIQDMSAKRFARFLLRFLLAFTRSARKADVSFCCLAQSLAAR
jgi:arginyl-tRNA synthetase